MNIMKLFHHPRSLVDFTPDQLQAGLKEHSPLLIDVRTPREYRAGHIAGAISIPLGQERMLGETISLDADVVLICKTGHRSQAAASTLLQLGFRQVSHLQGGMDAWRRSGKPVET